ncbi:hypothetical protein [Actinomadura sp. 1N219]|uniref:hypothetical protein n=1 Tax=Actinomadura sp. 1N219 TaxID=3375152 RepID=UPI0037BF9742
MTANRHGERVGRNRVLEMLAILQTGLCGRCGRARYATRRNARHAARIAAPGTRLRAYRCGDAWHLTTPPGRPQFIAPPVTVPRTRPWIRLDLHGRDQRRYRNRHRPRSGRTPGHTRRVGAGSAAGRR